MSRSGLDRNGAGGASLAAVDRASATTRIVRSTSSADYVRAAREAGHSLQDIGTALGLVPGGDAQQAGETAAEAAFTYAAGHPDTEMARRYGNSRELHRTEEKPQVSRSRRGRNSDLRLWATAV
jgi:hypothetical protein